MKNRYIENLNTVVFDIETTGLKAESSIIISASFCDTESENLRQYFCDDPSSEYLLISKILEELSAADAVITYNGVNFDLPFLLTRAKKYGLADRFPVFWSIDLYMWLRKYWPVAKLLPSLTQKSVEHALNLDVDRTDEIGGAECISLYNRYLASGNENIKDTILLHNADDVKQLARVAEAASFLPYSQIAYEQGFFIKYRADYTGADDIKISVSGVEYTKDRISVNAMLNKGLTPLDVFEDDYHLQYESYTGIAKLEIFLSKLENYQYVDLKNFPLDPEDFKDSENFTNDYIILFENGVPKYKEINMLTEEMLRKL